MAQTVEVLLRPAVELYTVAVCAGSAVLCLAAPWALALTPSLGLGAAVMFTAFGTIRLRQAWVILRYRRNIRRLPRYALRDDRIPVSQERLFLGRGFRWEPHHTHRLLQTYRPEFRHYVEAPWRLRYARHLEQRLEFAPRPIPHLARLTAWDHPLNPVRPLPTWAACRACMVWNRMRWTSPCPCVNASATPWCSAPPASAKPAWPNC